MKDKFPVPTSGDFIRWEAERAIQRGAPEVVEHPLSRLRRDVAAKPPHRASGGAYVKASAGDALEFPFELAEEAELCFYPEWWRHGEQKPAKRFPHPFPKDFGPTALAACGDKVFFNAPVTGCIGVMDAETERLLDPIEVGGYPIDMACDLRAAKIYVVDAAGNRVVVVDAKMCE